MKKLVLSAMVIAATLAVTAKTDASDPVVMTVDNRDVKLSEFEYLYNKNSNQQLEPLTFDEYVDMFVNYKLKVADALNARLDTTTAYRTEFEKFRRDLAQPYLKDKETEQKLIHDAYDHTLEDVKVSHIMLPVQDPNAKHKIDSIRELIVSGAVTFEDAAMNNSVDRPSAMRGGLMGWVTGMGPYPWPFEAAAYDTPVGQVSEPVNSGVGYHLIRPEERRKSRGEVQVQHILLLTRGMSPEEAAVQKERIDSIYQLVTVGGADFAETARQNSEDPGSAREGGLIDWFGSGRMVAEFDSVAFALPVGGISEPFATSYGYHIVHKLGARGVKPFEEMRPAIQKAIEKDNMRSNLAMEAKIAKTAEATGSSLTPDLDQILIALTEPNNGAVDQKMIDRVKGSQTIAYTVNGKNTTIAEALKDTPLQENVPTYVLLETAQRWIENGYKSAVINYIIEQLELNEPAYSNLLNEYRDGLLLFDVSNSKVWDRGAKDKEGQKAFFLANRDKYSTWTAPHYKAYVIFASNDSVLSEVMTFAETNYGGQKISEINQEEFTAAVKEKFPRGVKMERVIATQGENVFTDYLGFGGPRPDSKNQSLPVYAAFAAEIIDQPEEVSDVKGAVVTDFQSQLEQQWLKDLKKKYKVKINKKALNSAKK